MENRHLLSSKVFTSVRRTSNLYETGYTMKSENAVSYDSEFIGNIYRYLLIR